MRLNRGCPVIKALLPTLAAIFCFSVSYSFGADSPQDNESVSLAFVGDIMLDELPGKLIRNGHDPFAPFAAILDANDIRVGNLECVISTLGNAEANKPFTFRAHPRTLNFLAQHFDALALANNHSGDFGPVAFAEMLGLLQKKGIFYFGGGYTLEKAHAPLVIERKGLRIALLAYNEFFPRSFEADYDKPGIAWSEDEQVQLDIRNSRIISHADLVIPVMHWGWEHEPLASQRQQQLAHLMIEAGADAVIGGHPHVTQNIEIFQGKPIIYSLGNFVFDGFADDDNNTGWLLKMAVDRNGVREWKIYITKIDKQGVPHPASQSSGQCWSRGDSTVKVCN